jgi:hypothetical protein
LRSRALRDVELLVAEVIELEHERIGLTAVDARPLAEELHEISRALGDKRLLAAQCVRYVALALRRVVGSFVVRPAGTAVVVPLRPCLAAPGEVPEPA